MKLSKEEQLKREKMIADGIAQVGLQVLDYKGVPSAYKTWERQQQKKRIGNGIKDKMDRGRGAGSAGARFIAKEK